MTSPDEGSLMSYCWKCHDLGRNGYGTPCADCATKGMEVALASARAAARQLLAHAQFESAEERLQFIEAHPWLRECHVCDGDSRCPAHQKDNDNDELP